MTKLTMMDLFGNKQAAIFQRYSAGVLWYRTEVHEFEFPVPVAELDGAQVMAREPATVFMRWIKRHLDLVTSAEKEHGSSDD